MAKKIILPEEIPQVWIQFKITQKEYADIQRAKANSDQPMQLNKDFYRELLLSAVNSKKL